MASPVFTSNTAFKPGATIDVNGKPVSAEDLQTQFDQPAATPVNTGRMSYEGVISKASGMVVLAFLTAVPGYMFFNYAGLFISAIVGLVLGLVLAFQRTTSPALALLYAAVQGYFLGSITNWVEATYAGPGAGLQALLATGTTFAVCLWLYRSGRVRYTPKLQKFLMIGLISYLVFSVINIFIMIFSGSEYGWGLRSDVEIAGIPLGVLIGIFAVVLGCISLIGDFDFIENGVKRGLPAKFEWTAAFGIVVTLIWLYIEFLRIIALLNRN